VATAGDGSAALTWTAPADNGGAAVTAYVITPYIGAAAQATTTVGNVTAATVTGLTNATAYTFKVAAVTASGTGAQSAASNSVTPVFSPASIAGLAAWFKADALGLADAAPVASWTDSSGNGRAAVQATAANQPTFKAAILNGLPVVRGDGVNDVLRTAGFTLAQPATTFIVARWASAAVTKCVHDGATQGSGAILDAASAIQIDASATTSTPFGSFGSFAVNTWKLLQVIWSGPTSAARDGGGAGTTLNPGTGSMGGVSLFAQGAGAGNWASADIAEVLEYGRALTLSELNLVGNYLANKYALAWATAT
jgi:hypothetical protein